MTYQRIVRVLLIALFFVAGIFFISLDGPSFFNIEHLSSQLELIRSLVKDHTLAASAVYFLIYILLTTLSVPGTGPLTLLAGAIFELWWGTILVSFASSIGATFAFLAARFVFRESINRSFAKMIAILNEGIDRNGTWYLLTLRLIPIFPFVLVNLGMGLTKLPTRTFYLVSQVGMLPATIVYVWAGKRFAEVREWGDILSPDVVLVLSLLAIAPFLIRLWVRRLKRPQPTASS